MKKSYNFALKKGKAMGRKKLERQPIERLYSKALAMLVPSHMLEHFEMWNAKEHKDRWVIEMREKESLIPEELREKEGVSSKKGKCHSSSFCKSISRQDSIVLLYLTLNREN
jgi:hypothetical protein